MARHQIERVRHNTRRRAPKVDAVTKLTRRMLRIDFVANSLQDFVSLSADDHVKLIFSPEGEAEVTRNYTPRRFDTVAGTMTIDFALHDGGVAPQWATNARGAIH